MLKQAAKMSLRQLVLLRSLSTSRCLSRPHLSAAYKSPSLWEERFNCKLLGSDTELIKTINYKITSDIELSNYELDVFINIAQARKGDVAQIQEAVTNLRRFRKTIYANTQIPSTSHALCRLFLDSEQLSSLMNLLEKRIEFGVFPDCFALNLLFDRAIEREDYSVGARLACTIMLQEEFGMNHINDNFALYSLAKYIESKSDFSDWNKNPPEMDPIFLDSSLNNETKKPEDTKKEEEASAKDDDDDEEDDAEYIRIPFLRNPYTDNHFDLTNPRLMCGKSLSMIGLEFTDQPSDSSKMLGVKCKLVGDILQGNWSGAQTILANHKKLKLNSDSTLKEALKYYIQELHDISSKLDDKERATLLASLEKLPTADGGRSLSDEADVRHESLVDLEKQDIEQLRDDIQEWSRMRVASKEQREQLEARKEIIEEIKRKKQELKEREEFLYFYDNLKKNSLTRLEYD